MRVEGFVPSIAIMLLIVGIFSTVYVQSLQDKTAVYSVKINGETFTLSEIQNYGKKTIQTSEGGGYTGISLADMINQSGIKSPETYNYKIIASDGYSKTIGWEYVKNGVFLVEEKKAVFADLPKQFWVRDIVEIKVS